MSSNTDFPEGLIPVVAVVLVMMVLNSLESNKTQKIPERPPVIIKIPKPEQQDTTNLSDAQNDVFNNFDSRERAQRLSQLDTRRMEIERVLDKAESLLK